MDSRQSGPVAGRACAPAGLDLYWIPLGAGTRVVRASGWIYERCLAVVQRRRPQRLFHSALVAHTGESCYFIEMTPIPADGMAAQRGVVGEGFVGSRLLGRFRLFRYEIRCWRDGSIPDIGYAVGSPVRVSDDLVVVRQILAVLPFVPTPVWGRDERRAGEMWNSNSVVAWALERAGIIGVAGAPPDRGRAPGWEAGVIVARSPASPSRSGRSYRRRPSARRSSRRRSARSPLP